MVPTLFLHPIANADSTLVIIAEILAVASSSLTVASSTPLAEIALNVRLYILRSWSHENYFTTAAAERATPTELELYRAVRYKSSGAQLYSCSTTRPKGLCAQRENVRECFHLQRRRLERIKQDWMV